jgi:hypothetical protein
MAALPERRGPGRLLAQRPGSGRYHDENRKQTHGYATTRDPAVAAPFAKSWRRE